MVKKRETNGDATPKKPRSSAAGKPPAKPPARRPVGASQGARPAAPPKGGRPAAKPGRTVVVAAPARPRLKASHVEVTEGSRVAVPKKKGPAGRAGAPLRKAPIVGPKRAAPRRVAAPEAAPPEPSTATRELALALAAAGLEKKAIGIEILDVSGKVDYADFLVIMTGRSDRHVHAIATGIEEALRSKNVRPLSMEGLQAATWVLIDFSDVVVHVFQEDTRRLYDIEGLWIDAGRVDVPVPPGAASGMEQSSSTSDLS